ncbi:PTS sugar transporter subunit IIA [Pelagerythrobacter aerophilus]|uniref:PTS sugar transporter subunit IIA n=1 Tax=Pelagerythrobacter aerophilus TaxID=2306995 RepID=A0A418NDT2_9SPHN|nr:PTS sugar transporter subunit IIA [Pelagerythrobacter aerophilus]RIV75975.1 PTS sugar transporter subunit IIA [Pelagerythrobacter aerophilus]RIV80770.1 PTS sugar transporter subunit IIA [Pelagerythrobacter aerophilus]
MNVHFKLIPEAFVLSDAGTKAAVLGDLAQCFARAYGFAVSDVLEALEEREKLGSTGFGRGVAIPHARLTGINRPVAAVLKLSAPVDFHAADGMPVELAFGLISPENAGVAHLHALAAISRLVRDEATNRMLLEATDTEALIASLTNASDRDVA